MHTVHYDIRDFKWVEKDNTFYGDGWDLFPAEEPYLTGAFPNGKKQFVIKNYQSGNFRKFTFSKDIYNEYGAVRMFTSEDGYMCAITME